jgi:hypothetical protein
MWRKSVDRVGLPARLAVCVETLVCGASDKHVDARAYIARVDERQPRNRRRFGHLVRHLVRHFKIVFRLGLGATRKVECYDAIEQG